MVHLHVERIFLWMAIGCLCLISSVSVVHADDYREIDTTFDEAKAYHTNTNISPSVIAHRSPSKGRSSPRAAPSSPTIGTASYPPPSPPVTFIELPRFNVTVSMVNRRLRKLESTATGSVISGTYVKDFVRGYLEMKAEENDSLQGKIAYIWLVLHEEHDTTYTLGGSVKIKKRYRHYQYRPTEQELIEFVSQVIASEEGKKEMVEFAKTYDGSGSDSIKKIADIGFQSDQYPSVNNDGDSEESDEGNSSNTYSDTDSNADSNTGSDNQDVNGGAQNAGWTGSHVTNDRGKGRVGKASAPVAMIGTIVALAILALTALFSYGYRRSTLKRSQEYEISDDHDHEDDIRPLEHESCVEMMKSRGLSDFAAGSSTGSKSSYMGMFNKAWTSTTNKMSDLAAGATQEEFAENGMKIDIYGANGKKSPRRSSGRSTENKKGGELATELEPIVEVGSELSGSELSGAESWHEGNGVINKAPPLLPALSVSSAPSDDIQLDEDVGNTTTLQQSPVDSNPNYSFHLDTLTLETPQDNAVMDEMTPYAEMTGIPCSPQLESSNDPKSPMAPVRCLNFSSGSTASDLDNNSDRSSSGSCVKDMLLDAMNPDTSDKSSDGCVKDMLEQMDDMISSNDDFGGEKESEIVTGNASLSTPDSSRLLTEDALIGLSEGNKPSVDNVDDTYDSLCENQRDVINKSLGDGNNRTPITNRKKDPFLVELDTNVPLSSSTKAEVLKTDEEENASLPAQPSSPLVDIGLD